MKKEKVFKIASIVGNVLLWAFVAFAVIITIVVLSTVANDDGSGMASIGGYSPVTVLTDSMSPTFKAGDLLIVHRVTNEEAQNLQVGQVISFLVDLNGDGEKEINSHRIVSVINSAGFVSYITQGDNKVTNQASDAPVSYANVLAVWNAPGEETGFRMAGIGGFINWLRTSTGFLVCIVIPLLLLFAWELFKFIRTVLAVKGYKSVSPAEAALNEELIRKRAIEEYLAQQKAAEEAAKQNAEAPAEQKAEATEEKPEATEEKPSEESNNQE